MPTVSKTDSRNRRKYVYEYMYENIIDLTYTPGMALSENDIASTLGVSRTPVREAFIQLAKEELIEIAPQIGTFVSLINPKLVEESRFMRETMEIAIIQLAAEQLTEHDLISLRTSISRQKLFKNEADYKEFMHEDDNFHRTIFQCLNKDRTWKAIDQMNAQFKRVRVLRLVSAGNSRWQNILEEHETIVTALETKNPLLAAQTMKEHLTKGIVHLDELQKEYPNYFKKLV